MHDQNFKNLILDYPVQALEFFAGEEAGSDLSEARIVPVRQEQLMERFRELDTPLLVECSSLSCLPKMMYIVKKRGEKDELTDGVERNSEIDLRRKTSDSGRNLG
ncbi:MAG: hypothetical protein GH155_01445 [Spirochaeta sp.]|nr:hypothetical protein [Spirochaeta sp.]